MGILTGFSEQADRCDVFSDLWCEADEGWLLRQWFLQSNSSVMLCRSQRNDQQFVVLIAMQQKAAVLLRLNNKLGRVHTV